MIVYRPLSGVTESSITRRPFMTRLEEIAWVPLSDSELLASAHHFPIAVRIDERGMQVVALLSTRFLARKLDENPATWNSRYVPMALRVFPFRLPRTSKGDLPQQALSVADDLEGPGYRQTFELIDKEGAASPLLKAAHMTLLRVRAGQPKLIELANLLFLCEALTPLNPGPAPGSNEQFLTIDHRRLNALRFATFAALSRSTYAPVDLISTLAFTQRHLREGAVDAATQLEHSKEDPGATQAAAPWLVPWLDMSGLFPANFASAFPADGEQPEPAPQD